MINGDFSALPFTINDPQTGQPFAGNQIPASRIDPVAKAFWDKYGYNIGDYGPNYNFQFANERKVWNFNGRVDYNLNQAAPPDAVAATTSTTRRPRRTPESRASRATPTGGTVGNTFMKGGNELSDFPQTVLNAKWTWTPTSNLVIETHGAYSKMPEKVTLVRGLARNHARDARGQRSAAAFRCAGDPADDGDRRLVGRRGDRRPVQRLDHGLHGQEHHGRLLGHLDQGLAQRQGRRRVPGRQLQHDQARAREQQRRQLQRQRHVARQPDRRRPGRHVRLLVRRLPARSLRHLRPGRRLRPDAAVLEPRAST